MTADQTISAAQTLLDILRNKVVAIISLKYRYKRLPKYEEYNLLRLLR